jgi:urease accessory protein
MRAAVATPSSSRCALSKVGRAGRLDLDYERQDGRTILTRSWCSSPWHLFPPMYLDSSGCAFTPLVNPSGGLVTGDDLSIHASIGLKAHVVLFTPSANRVYRALDGDARQTVTLSVASGAKLEWFPDVTIPFAGSRFVQTVDLRLATGASALIWDSLASGRVARGERWQFECVQNEVQITTSTGDRLLERWDIAPKRYETALVHAYDYVASLFVVSEELRRETWSAMREDLAAVLDSLGEDLLGGVSEPSIPGLVVKLAARSAQSLASAQAALWHAARLHLCGLAKPELRRY